MNIKIEKKKISSLFIFFFGIICSFGFFVNYSQAVHVSDSYCSNKNLRICCGDCATIGAWCDAQSWTSYCPTGWYNTCGTSQAGRAVSCCNATDCNDNNECTNDSCSDYSCSYTNKADGSSCSNGKCRSGVCTKYITECHGDDQEAYGLYVTYSDGSTSNRTYAQCLSSGGTANVAYGPPEGEIRNYSCSVGDFAIKSSDRDCGSRDSLLCSGSYVTYYSHCNYYTGANYWNGSYGYCGWVPGDCATCTSNGLCANGTDRATLCTTEVCLDNCGNPISGTKDCSVTTVPTPALTVSCNSSGLVSSSWTAVSGADYYALRIDTDTAIPHLLQEDSLTTTSKTWQGVSGTSYNVWVHAIDNGVWSGYEIKNVTCSTTTTPYSCTGTAPNGSSTIMCTSDNTSLTSTLAWTNVGTSSSSCTSTRKCEYYTPATTYSCSGDIPDGSYSCPDDHAGLTSSGSWHEVGTSSSSCTDTTKCEYYTPIPTPTCIGNRPIGTISWGDDVEAIQWKYSSTDTSRNCEYRCATNYVWNGSICVAGPSLDFKITKTTNPEGVESVVNTTKINDDFVLGSSADFTYTVSGTSAYPTRSCEASVSNAEAGNWTGPKYYLDGKYTYPKITPATMPIDRRGQYEYRLTCYNSIGAYTSRTVSIRVEAPTAPNQPPTAEITGPTGAEDINYTSSVSKKFEGRGTGLEAGETISAYRWFISNSDTYSEGCTTSDPTSTPSTPYTSNRTNDILLSNNTTYSVCFRVKDSRGAWSAPDYLKIIVGTPPPPRCIAIECDPVNCDDDTNAICVDGGTTVSEEKCDSVNGTDTNACNSYDKTCTCSTPPSSWKEVRP